MVRFICSAINHTWSHLKPEHEARAEVIPLTEKISAGVENSVKEFSYGSVSFDLSFLSFIVYVQGFHRTEN